MSVTAASVLKKIAAVVPDKKAWKTVGGIVLGTFIIIFMPIAAVIGLFQGTLEIDSERLQERVVENLSAEAREKLLAAEETLRAALRSFPASPSGGRGILGFTSATERSSTPAAPRSA